MLMLPLALSGVLMITAAVFFTGGVHSHLWVLYVVPVIFTAALLESRLTSIVVGSALLAGATPLLNETASRFADMRFVIDHIAKPSIRDGQGTQAWAEAMAPFSELNHVRCKLSGMVTEADWTHWRPQDLVPYVDQVLRWFGPGRCMFGSDWPVCLLAADYGQVFQALLTTLDGLDRTATDEVLGATAIRVYQLEGLDT
jgi:predicted TIM-barrel fold metal-dependent hydrolase